MDRTWLEQWREQTETEDRVSDVEIVIHDTVVDADGEEIDSAEWTISLGDDEPSSSPLFTPDDEE